MRNSSEHPWRRRSISTGQGRDTTLWRTRRAIVALEFAILSLPFFMLMLFILELSYDLYTQEALDAAVHIAVRQIQTGNAQNVTNGGSFVSGYVCPAMNGLLECGSHVYVKITKVTFTGSQDFYNYTTGSVPTSGHNLDLVGGGYLNADGTSTFCNSGPGQFILVSAIYLGPSFIGGILPGVLSVVYNGTTVHASLSTTGAVTESYAATSASAGTTPAKACT